MGYFNNQELEIMEMAHDMGDDFGDDAETVLVISRVLSVPVAEVQRVLAADYDADPSEYAERAADLDCEYYAA